MGDEAADGAVQGHGQHAPLDGIIQSPLQIFLHRLELLPRDFALGGIVVGVWHTIPPAEKYLRSNLCENGITCGGEVKKRGKNGGPGRI
jgi:hypothetical protein